MAGRKRGARSEGSVESSVGGSDNGSGEGSGPATIFESMDENAYVVVKRLDPDSKQYNTLGRLEPELVTEEVIAMAGGGGKYLLQEKLPRPEGGFKFGRQATIVVEGPAKRFMGFPGAVTPATVAGQPVVAGVMTTPQQTASTQVNTADIMNAGLLQLFQANKEVQAMQMEAVKAIGSRPQLDIVALIAALAPVVKAMVEKPTEKVDVLAIVEKVTEMVKVNTSPANSFKEQVEMMNEVLDLKERTVPPAADEGDSLMGVVSQHLGKLLDIIQQGQRKGQKPPPPRPEHTARILASPDVVPPATPVLPAAPSGEPAWHRVVEPWRKHLIGLARSGKDADTTARFLFMVAPDVSKGVIREFMVASPDPAADLISFIPDLQPYANWVGEFVDEIADTLGLFDDDGAPGNPAESTVEPDDPLHSQL